MPTPKRLFLIAGYEAKGNINPAIVHQVRELSKHGDCVFVMDYDARESELAKLKTYCIYTLAIRHREYDFGSYKRGFTWAMENLDLSNYDFMYMLNDSVYGPLFDIESYLKEMESFGTEAFGMVKKTGGRFEHIQSWFIGMTKTVFLSQWFKQFILSVKQLKTKTDVTELYENGFTQQLNDKEIQWKCLYNIYNRGIYNRIKHLFKIRMPFMKKLAWTRHYGSLGRQILFVLNRLPPNLRRDILISARDTLGTQYVNWLLTKNPLKIFIRKIKYIISRLH